MRKVLVLAVLLAAWQMFGLATGAIAADFRNDWLMMVSTRNTDPARAADFNAWYNKVDIPDVLSVPGYVRARRGQRQGAAEGAEDPKGNYVALYNIKSRNLDKTIIAMLMASWQMEKDGHSTSLLAVTERVYFHQYAPVYLSQNAAPSGAEHYLLLVRINCCADRQAEKKFDAWYDSTYLPAIMHSGGVVRATRYKLDRVLMDKPVRIPNFLTVFEIDTDSVDRSIAAMRATAQNLARAGRMSPLYSEERSDLFLKIKDVSRN